jgi:hypothetical protein
MGLHQSGTIRSWLSQTEALMLQYLKEERQSERARS